MKKIIITLAIIIAALNVFGQNYKVFVDGKEIVDTQKVSMNVYITNFLNNSTDSSYMVIKDKDTDVYVVVSNGDFFVLQYLQLALKTIITTVFLKRMIT